MLSLVILIALEICAPKDRCRRKLTPLLDEYTYACFLVF